MENNNDSLSVSSLRDWQTRLEPNSSGTDSLIVSGCTGQLQFDVATNEGISLLEVPQNTFSKGKKQPGDNRGTKWNKNMNKLVMQCYFKSDPLQRNYRKIIHVIWNEIGRFELTEQKLVRQARAIRRNKWLLDLEL